MKEVKGNLSPSGTWMLSTFPGTAFGGKGKIVVREPTVQPTGPRKLNGWKEASPKAGLPKALIC